MTQPAGEFLPAAPLRPVLRTRASAFSYECRACGRCCRYKRIPVNPYETARLAAHLGIGTTELIARYTDDGTALTVRPDITCIFLDANGCSVHAARPLACRLYPLGLVATPEGEAVVELEPDPGSEGVRGEAGTVADYLEAQDVAPFLEASHRYHRALERLVAALAAACGADAAAGVLAGDDASPGDAAASAAPAGDDAPSAAPEILDLDACLTLLARRGLSIPESLDARIDLHLSYLEELAGTVVPTGSGAAAGGRVAATTAQSRSPAIRGRPDSFRERERAT